MKKYLLVFLLVLASLGASAQKYRTALGGRIGREDFGLTLQQKVLEKSTLEGILALGSREVSGTVLFEQHFPLLGKSFNYYLGGGAHVGTLKDHGTFVGGDVILGTELKLPIFPLLFSFDIKPAVHAGHEDWFDFASGFSLRYILVKEKKEKRKFGIFRDRDPEERDRRPGIFGGDQQERRGKRNKARNKEQKRGWFD